jgi:hypothetical protein
MHEKIFGYYRDRIEQRYIICAVFLGLCCAFLFGEPFPINAHWIVRGLQTALTFISGGLALSFLLRYQSLITHLDARYPDSLQRFEDFIMKDGLSGLTSRQRLFPLLMFLSVFLTVSFFFLQDKKTLGMVISAGVLIPLGWLIQKQMGNQDKKLLAELKNKFQDQALTAD